MNMNQQKEVNERDVQALVELQNKVKQFTFTLTMSASREINVLIKDEAKFKELCKEHIEDGNTINYWDLDDMDDEVVELDYKDVDWEEEDDEDFFYEMSRNGFDFCQE